MTTSRCQCKCQCHPALCAKLSKSPRCGQCRKDGCQTKAEWSK